jgi:hypothetical protein
MASELDVVNLEVLHTTAHLAPPAVPLKDLAMQFAIVRRVQFHFRSLVAGLTHDALTLISDKKTSCCGAGRNR